MSYNTGTDPTLAELITASFIPPKYSKDIVMHTQSNLVVGNHVRKDVIKGLEYGYVHYFPVFDEAATSEVTPGTEPTPVDGANATPKSITVNKWYQQTHEISRMSKIQSFADYFAAASKSQAYTIAKKVDTDLGALFPALSSGSIYGADGQEFTADIFTDLVEDLDENDVPDDGMRALIGDPSTRRDIIKNCPEFIRTDYVREPVVPTGKIGRLLNVTVAITNNLTTAGTGNYGALLHPEAIGLAIQADPFTHLDNLQWKFITRLTTEIIYGVGELRDTFGKAFYTRKT